MSVRSSSSYDTLDDHLEGDHLDLTQLSAPLDLELLAISVQNTPQVQESSKWFNGRSISYRRLPNGISPPATLTREVRDSSSLGLTIKIKNSQRTRNGKEVVIIRLARHSRASARRTTDGSFAMTVR
jgi:hypothetical protein